MQVLENLPWYTYILLAVMVVSFVYHYFKKAKRLMQKEPDLIDAEFRTDPDSTLNDKQLFSMALYAINSEYWEENTNTLAFSKEILIDNNYVKNWGIDTREGYWEMANYFMQNGRRWYFDFIFDMVQTQPEEKWNDLIHEHYGDNKRALSYVESLKTGETLKKLKTNEIITFDSEMELGIAAFDVVMLIEHTRFAYTAELISKQEAWEVIDVATQLAKEHFSSWEEFGKSYLLGISIDLGDIDRNYVYQIYHLYKQVQENPESLWNTINWQN